MTQFRREDLTFFAEHLKRMSEAALTYAAGPDDAKGWDFFVETKNFIYAAQQMLEHANHERKGAENDGVFVAHRPTVGEDASLHRVHDRSDPGSPSEATSSGPGLKDTEGSGPKRQ